MNQDFIRSFCLPLAVLTTLGALLVARQNTAQVEVKAHEVAGAISYLEGSGGNIGVSVGSDGVLLVDSQFSWLAPKISEAVGQLADEKPVFLVNTHWHGDHVGGNTFFAGEATVLAHSNVRRRMAQDPTVEGRVAEELQAGGLPVVTFDQGLTLHFNGEEIRVMHYPAGHTDGDSVVWFQGSNVVHMGDLYFQSGYPFIDVDSGGSVEGYLAAVEGVLSWAPADARIISGHGVVTGVDELREYRDMISILVERVREALAAGLSTADMIEGGLSSDYDQRWAPPGHFIQPARFLETLATELAE